MPHQVDGTNKPGDGQGDHCLPATRFKSGETCKASQPSTSQNEGNARKGQGGPAQIAAPAVNAGQRPVSAKAQAINGHLSAASYTGAARLRNNAWTPGFERAMHDLEGAGRASVPAPIGHGRPPASLSLGRSVSTANQGVAVPASSGAAPVDLAGLREGIENVVEQQVADALSPLRLIVNSLAESVRTVDSLRSLRQESADFHEQNDIMSRQLDLHYCDIQQHSELANTHVRALTNLVDAHARIDQAANENLAMAATLVGHLSQVVVNLPYSVGQVVHATVAQATQNALTNVMNAQQESFGATQEFFNHQYAHFDLHRAAWVQQLSYQQYGYQGVGVAAPAAPAQQPQADQGTQDEKRAGNRAGAIRVFLHRVSRFGRK